MESLKKYLSTFDVLLFGGLGCGVLILCVLGSAFVYIWQNPPGPSAPAAPPSLPILKTATPPAIDISSPTLSPTLIPTQSGAVTPMPDSSFIPDFGGGPVPSGKIVFTCYINQIDQICIMNAAGTGRKQLTNFPATAFYPSLSRDGQT